jgi:hypothetical protein
LPLPPEQDQKIRNRFDELIDEANELIPKMNEHKRLNPTRHFPNYGHVSEFQAIGIKVKNLIETVLGESQQQLELTAQIKNLARKPSALEHMIGTLQGLKNTYENGFLDNLEEKIVANISADYMTQVEELLGEGQPGQYDHVPAAVLCGAVLEDALRRLCDRQTPPVPTEKPNGQPKALNALIQDLQKANAFNKLKAQQLRGWAQVRNSAAHGKFDEFSRDDVELMVKGVNNFLADYL